MQKSTFSTKDGTLQKLHQLLTSMKRSALSRINGTVALVTHSLVAPSFFFFKFIYQFLPSVLHSPFLPSLSSQPLTSRDKRNSPDLSLPSHPKGRPPVPLPYPNRLLHLPPPLSCHPFTCDVIVPKFSLKDFLLMHFVFCSVINSGGILKRFGFQTWVPKHARTKSSPQVSPLEDQQCGVSKGCSIFLK